MNSSAPDPSTKILLVSSWQTVNIGDVAHSPGALQAFERYAPDAELTLWALSLDDRERSMLAAHLPGVRVIEEKLEGGEPGPLVRAAFEESDVLVHGSGPSVVAAAELRAWQRHTAKPYGFFGVTVDPLGSPATLDQSAAMIDSISLDMLTVEDRVLFDGAAFVYCRDSLTARFLRGQQISCPVVEFGPDATINYDLLDDEGAERVLSDFGLSSGDFVCVVPRQRYTPYYRLRGYAPQIEDARKEAVNAGHTDADMAVLQRLIVEHVRRSGQRVLVVPEMSYEVELAEHYFTDLPADVRDRVDVLAYFWDLPLAAAVYARAAAVVSMECHSPLIATAVGTPSCYVRQPTDTIKGWMYRDLGLGERLFEVAPDPSTQMLDLLSSMVTDRTAARAVTAAARTLGAARLHTMVDTTLAAARRPVYAA